MVDADPDVAAARFLRTLDAAAARVGAPWFQLPYRARDATAAELRYRERVYCYELYHQIRLLDEGGAENGEPRYVLSGEVDKAGLAVITNGANKPDFLWHVPGDWRHNAVVMEVKGAHGLTRSALRKDLETLRALLDPDGPAYALGVMLFCGERARDELLAFVMRTVDDPPRYDGARHDSAGLRRRRLPSPRPLDAQTRRRIRLLLHPGAGEGLVDLGTLQR